MRFRQINDIRNIIFLNLKSYLYLILEDISISETTSFPTTETTQDITYFETTTQRTVRQTTISANTPRAGEKPLTKEPENETSTQSISYTASPTQVFKGIPFQSNRSAVIIPTVAVVSAIAVLLFFIVGLIMYKRYDEKI